MCSPQKSPLNFSSWIFSVSIVSQTVTFAPGSSGLFFVFQCLGSCLPCGQSALEEFQVRQKKIMVCIGEGRRIPLHKFSKETPARPNKQAQFLRHKIFPVHPETWFPYSDCVLLPLRPPRGHIEKLKGLRQVKMPPKFPAMLQWSFLAKHSNVCYQLLASPWISVKLIPIDFPRFLCSWWQIPGASFPQFYWFPMPFEFCDYLLHSRVIFLKLLSVFIVRILSSNILACWNFGPIYKHCHQTFSFSFILDKHKKSPRVRA